MDIGRAAQRKVDHARADRLVAHAVDQDERTQRLALPVRLEGERMTGVQRHFANVVQLQRVGRETAALIDIELVFDVGDGHADLRGVQLDQVGPPRHQPMLGHTQHAGLKLVADLDGIVDTAQHLAAADIDLAVERDGYRIAGAGDLLLALPHHDGFDPGLGSARHDAYGRADSHAARGDVAAVAAKLGVGAIDVLHRHAERARFLRPGDIDRFQIFDQGRPGVPVNGGTVVIARPKAVAIQLLRR